MPDTTRTMNILGIDPSILRPGVCLVEYGHEKKRILFSEQLKIRSNGSLPERLIDLDKQCYDFFGKIQSAHIDIDVVIIEEPTIQTTGKGAYGLASGNIAKLFFSYGTIIVTTHQYATTKIYSVIPIKWKGHVPKTITKKRMLKEFGSVVTGMSHDEIDALALTHYAWTNGMQ